MAELHPVISTQVTRVSYVSKVRYRYGNPQLLQKWRERGPQIVHDNSAFAGASGVIEKWTVYAADDDDFAIMELAYEGPMTELTSIQAMHDAFVRAHLIILPEAHLV